jgi:hypothetical protein
MKSRNFLPLAALIFLAACATASSPIERVQAYRAAARRGDVATEQRYLAPDARMWFEKREGEGERLTAGRSGRYAHWDEYFHSTATDSDWTFENGAVSATVHETNDFYRLAEWTPKPYRMTWWLDSSGRIREALLTSMPGETVSRLDEFREWARREHPEELEYVMPKGRIDPTADRAERFKLLLLEWRKAIGLP